MKCSTKSYLHNVISYLFLKARIFFLLSPEKLNTRSRYMNFPENIQDIAIYVNSRFT